MHVAFCNSLRSINFFFLISNINISDTVLIRFQINYHKVGGHEVGQAN